MFLLNFCYMNVIRVFEVHHLERRFTLKKRINPLLNQRNQR